MGGLFCASAALFLQFGEFVEVAHSPHIAVEDLAIGKLFPGEFGKFLAMLGTDILGGVAQLRLLKGDLGMRFSGAAVEEF